MLQQAIRLMDGGGPQDIYDMAAWVVRQHLDGATIDTLHALIKVGPVWDGDLPSKTGRNTLVELGLAAKCVVQGKQGFQVATYRGWNVYYAQIDSGANTAAVSAQAMPEAKAPEAKEPVRWLPN